jgi:hypothetical protein
MTHKVTKANSRSVVAFRLRQSGKPIALSGLTVKVLGKTSSFGAWIAESVTGVTQEPTFTFTADGTSKLATSVSHIVVEGDQIVVSNSGGALPSGLSANTPYFAVNVTKNAFGLATVPGGVSVIAGAGTGTQAYYIVGLVTYDWQTADVATAALGNRLYFNIYNGSEFDTIPADQNNGTSNEGFRVDVGEIA